MKRGDWLPSKRDEQLTMAKNWNSILHAKRSVWMIPEDVCTRFSLAVGAAEGENNVPAGQRNAVSNARLKSAINELVALMRDVKKRYFFIPPLNEAELVSLGLRMKDTTPTSVSDPTGQAKAIITYTGPTQLLLRITHVEGTPIDKKANYGCRVYYGKYAAADTPPSSGKDLRESVFTRQKKLLLTFEPEDTGKTAHFCMRYENSKGKAGPWGPMFAAVIP